MYNDCSVEVKSIGTTLWKKIFISQEFSWYEAFNHQTTASWLIIRKKYFKLIRREESFASGASAASAENWNPWPVTAGNAVLLTT